MSLFIATDSNFKTEVLNSSIPVLVDFWGEWCTTCKALNSLIEELANEYEGQIRIAKLDIESNPDVVMNYGIRNFPTLLLFKSGQVVDSVVGLVKRDMLIDKIENQL